MDVVKEDMKLAGVREEVAEGRVWWRQSIRCDDPWREQKKGKDEEEEGGITKAATVHPEGSLNISAKF